MSGASVANTSEVGADNNDVDSQRYPPQATFTVTDEWRGGYCGDLIIDNAPPRNSWQVSANLDDDIVRIAGGHYRGAIGRSYNLVFTPDLLGTAIRHRISLCVEGDDLLKVYGVDWGEGLRPDPVPIRELKRGYYGQHTTRRQTIVANTEEELKRIEYLVGGSLEVSIDRYTVIAAFMGSRPTGGYSIEVSKAVEVPGRPDRVDVELIMTSPGVNCIVTQAFTSPYHVVAIPKTDKPFRFVDRQEVIQCDY